VCRDHVVVVVLPATIAWLGRGPLAALFGGFDDVSTQPNREDREAARALVRTPRARFVPESPVDGFEVWRFEGIGGTLGYCAIGPDTRKAPVDSLGRCHRGPGHTRAGFGASAFAAVRELAYALEEPAWEADLEGVLR
jgi:hypothetical protein